MMDSHHANKIVAWTLTAVLALSIVLLGFTQWRTDKITVAIPEGVEGVALRFAAQRFSESHRISVDVQPSPYDELYENEENSIENKAPVFDVIMLDDPWLPALVKGNKDDKTEQRLTLLAPRNWEEYDLDDFLYPTRLVSSCLEASCNSDFDYYAVPFVGNSQLFCSANADLTKLPTWDAVVSTGGRYSYVTRIGPGNSVVTDFMPILWAYEPPRAFRPNRNSAIQRLRQKR